RTPPRRARAPPGSTSKRASPRSESAPAALPPRAATVRPARPRCERPGLRSRRRARRPAADRCRPPLRLSPYAPVGLDQAIGFGRSPRPRGVVGERRRRQRLPRFFDAIDPGPRRLDLVAAREQRAVAEEAIEDQSLVRFGRLGAERSPVAELHRHRQQLHRRAGYLGEELERDALVRLNANR